MEFDNDLVKSPTTDECPCKNETPDSIEIKSNTDTLIITIHGTKAKHAKWTYAGRLVRLLSENKPNTQISRFCWSGKNSHSKRLKAGRELADHIQNLCEKYPDIQFILLGHSHGGNIIMYALNHLRETNDINRVEKVVTLVTPYLFMKLKKMNPLIMYSTFFLMLVCLIDFMLADWQLQTNYFAIIVVVIVCVWQLLIFISILSQKNKAKRLLQYLMILIGIDRNLSILENDIAAFDLKQNEPGPNSHPKQLIIRPVGDEASMALVFSQFLSWANVLTLKLFSIVSNKFMKYLIKVTKEFSYRLGGMIGFGPNYELSSDMNYDQVNKRMSAYLARMTFGNFIIGMFSFILTAYVFIFLLGPFVFPKYS